MAESLYARLGGYDAISAVCDDLLARMNADPQLARFWKNRGNDGVKREKQLIINFLSASAGGPIHYVGRDMKLSHEGMGIDESDWRIFVGCLNATLDKFNVPEPERAQVVGFIDSTKPNIVE